MGSGPSFTSFAELLKLAIRAQSACRPSLESLSVIQNPRAVAFVRAENAKVAHQQVNIQGGVGP